MPEKVYKVPVNFAHKHRLHVKVTMTTTTVAEKAAAATTAIIIIFLSCR